MTEHEGRKVLGELVAISAMSKRGEIRCGADDIKAIAAHIVEIETELADLRRNSYQHYVQALNNGQSATKAQAERDVLKAENRRLKKTLRLISCPTQTKDLLWWQAAARNAINGGSDDG